MHASCRIPARRRTRGFSMIELLVALVVVSLGVGSAMIAHGRGLLALNGTNWRAQAGLLAEQLLDRARSNPRGGYAVSAGTYLPTESSVTTRDLSAWKSQLARSLPSGDGYVTVTPTFDAESGTTFDVLDIVVTWNDRRAGAGDTGDVTRAVHLRGYRGQP